MDRDTKKQMITHFAVSSFGGFMGGYAIINFCELFANAQTANMIHLVSKLFEKDYSGLVFVIASLFSYMAGNSFCVLFKKFTNKDMRASSLIMDVFVVAAVGILVHFTSISFVLLPILFVMPVQWNAFNDDAGYISSTIFSTNNLRQATMSLVSYLTDKDKAQLKKTKFFWLTILSFHIGVAMVCAASLYLGTSSIWFGFIPAFAAVAAYCNQKNIFSILRMRLRRLRKNPKSA